MSLILLIIIKLTGVIPIRLLYALRTSGLSALKGGRCIIALNHSSMMDATLMNMALPSKRIYFLCSRKLFQCPRICQKFLSMFGAIPVGNPAVDMDRMRELALKSGKHDIIGYFAQGMISASAKSFRPGAALLAMQTGLPLLPVYIRTAFFYRGGSRIRVGEPIQVAQSSAPSPEEVMEVTRKLQESVYALASED